MFLGRDVGHQRDYSDGLAERIDSEVRTLIDQARDEAWKVLTANRPILDRLAKELLEKETLDHNQLAGIFAKVKKLPERPVWKSNPKRPVTQRDQSKAMPAKASAEPKKPTRARKPKPTA
jgi:cell division protease FtsH